jgi:flagellar motor switch protein FliM
VPLNAADARPAFPPRSGVQPYDFRHPTKLSRDNARVMQMVYDGFARRLTTVFTSALRQVCHVSVGDITQRSYEEYIAGLASPTLLVPMSLTPLHGTGVLEFSLPVALGAIDHLLGGPGGPQPTRTLTEIEVGLVGGLLDQMVATFRHAFDPVVALASGAGAIEYNPQFLQAAAPTDAMVTGEFALHIGREKSRLTLCLPLAPLLPRLDAQFPGDRSGAGQDGSAATAARRLRARLGDVPVDVSARFAPVRIPSDRLLSLRPGDVIPLPHRVGAPLRIHVGDRPFAAAVAGRSGSTLAALIVDNPQEIS